MQLLLTGYTINPHIKTKDNGFLLTSKFKAVPSKRFAAVSVIRRNDDGQITFQAIEGKSKEEIIERSSLPELFNPIGSGLIIFTGKKFFVSGEYRQEVSSILKKAYSSIPVI